MIWLPLVLLMFVVVAAAVFTFNDLGRGGHRTNQRRRRGRDGASGDGARALQHSSVASVRQSSAAGTSCSLDLANSHGHPRTRRADGLPRLRRYRRRHRQPTWHLAVSTGDHVPVVLVGGTIVVE